MSAGSPSKKPSKVRVTIREARPADCAVVAEFEQQLSITTEGSRLDEAAVERGVRVPLERPNLAKIFVACVYRRGDPSGAALPDDTFVEPPLDDGSSEDSAGAGVQEEIIGFMTAGSQWVAREGGFVHFVFSTFIVEAFRGRGVFGQLFRYVKNYVLSDRLSVGMRLYVERENSRAQETYKRLGMEIEDLIMYKWMKPDDQLPSSIGASSSGGDDTAGSGSVVSNAMATPLPPSSPVVARPDFPKDKAEKPWRIRLAEAHDIPSLVAMQKDHPLFRKSPVPPEDADRAVRRGIAMAWAEPGLARIYVAELDGSVIGMTVVTNEWSEWRGGIVYWLTSSYVVPEHRRKGVLSSLFAFAKAQVQREPNAVGLRMQTATDDTAGRAVAAKIGLTEEPYYMMRWADPTGAVVSRESGIR